MELKQTRGCWRRAGQSEEVFNGNTLLKLLAAAGVKTPASCTLGPHSAIEPHR